jgi:hypothetical protein
VRAPTILERSHAVSRRTRATCQAIACDPLPIDPPGALPFAPYSYTRVRFALRATPAHPFDLGRVADDVVGVDHRWADPVPAAQSARACSSFLNCSTSSTLVGTHGEQGQRPHKLSLTLIVPRRMRSTDNSIYQETMHRANSKQTNEARTTGISRDQATWISTFGATDFVPSAPLRHLTDKVPGPCMPFKSQ